jgi:hypothetical protein
VDEFVSKGLTVVEFLDLLCPGLVEEVVQLLPSVALLHRFFLFLEVGKRTHLQAAQGAWEVAAGYLTEADGELTQVRLGEADERAAGVGNPRRRGGCDTQGAREGGDADVLRRGRHFLLLFCDWDGCLLIHVLVSCCRMGRAHGLRWGLSSLCIWLKK